MGRGEPGDRRVPLGHRHLEHLAQAPVGQECRSRGSVEVAADVEAEAELRPPGDAARQVDARQVAQHALALGQSAHLERKVERQRHDLGVEERHARLDRVLHGVLVLAVEQVGEVGAEVPEECRLERRARGGVVRVRRRRALGHSGFVGV